MDEQGLIKVWKAENRCEQASFCLPSSSSALEVCDIPEGPLLLRSDPTLRSLCSFPGSVDTCIRPAVLGGISSQAFHVADQVITLFCSVPLASCLPQEGRLLVPLQL